jgi:hypothetical protein
MSVLTEFITQARQEDAERRKKEREEWRIEREERKGKQKQKSEGGMRTEETKTTEGCSKQ